MQLIMAIEEEFGIDIPNDEATKLETVGKICSYVQSRLARDNGQSFDEAAAAVLWERVKQIVVEELGVKPELVTRDAHIVYDLGAD